MSSWRCRPATISSKKALLWGVFWMLGGAILGWYFSVVPTSIVDYTWGHTALINYVIYGVVIWVALVLPTLLLMWFSERRVAVMELVGRMLYAHIPVTLVMLPAAFGDKVRFSIFMASPFSSQLPTVYSLLMLLYVVVVVVWFFYWGYIAFRQITQFRGWYSVMLYSIAMYGSYLLSDFAIWMLIKM